MVPFDSGVISKGIYQKQPDSLDTRSWRTWLNDTEIFKMIVDNIAVLVSVFCNPHIIYVNSAFRKLTGYSLKEVQKMNFWDIVHPDHREMAKARGLARLRGESVPPNYEFKALKKNGETIWLNLFFSATHIGNKSITISGSIDITESKRLREELQAAHDEMGMRVKERTEELNRINQELIFTNQNLGNVLRNISSGVVTVSRCGDFEILNSSFSSANDKSLTEIKAKLKDLFIRREILFVNRMIDDSEPFRDKEINLVTANGPVCFLTSGTPILNEEGLVNSGVISLRPIKEVHGLVNRYSGFQATFRFEDIITGDRLMLDLINNARRAASGMSNVLIHGGSGTGKELFAQAIHNESPRLRGPFLAVNCGAIPRELIGSELFGYAEGAFTGARKGGNPGKFELANGGTIFLDEIGDLPFEQQSALLRVLQDKTVTRIGGCEVIPIDVRIICATNKDLALAMQNGSFRHDLYYRLNVINIKIPSLYDRPSDVILLFDHFLKTMAPQLGKQIERISNEVRERLLKYPWPGNVRELQNVVERTLNIMTGSRLEVEHLPAEIRNFSGTEGTAIHLAGRQLHSAPTIQEARALNRRRKEAEEKGRILKLLDIYCGNVSRVAHEMGISRTTLYKKMRHPM